MPPADVAVADEPRARKALARVAVAAAAAALTACGAAASPSSGAAPPTAARSALPVRVLRVTGVPTPDDPRVDDAGPPAEEVEFRLGPHPRGGSCAVVVRHRGTIVGSATVGVGAAVRTVPVDVPLTGPTFSGAPGDARVDCWPL